MKRMLKIPRNATSPILKHEKTFDGYADRYEAAAELLWKTSAKGGEHITTPEYLVLPVLFLLHHFVELELKEVIRLSHSLGQSRELPVEGVADTHNLLALLKIADSNLKLLNHDGHFLTGHHRELIADLEQFGRSGEALRFPEEKESKKRERKTLLPDEFIADVTEVLRITESMWGEFSTVIGILCDWGEQQLVTLHQNQ